MARRGFTSNYRVVLLAAVVFACLGGVGTRLVFLHIIDRGKLLGYIEQVRRQVVVEPARRGNIYDAHQHLLATNQSVYTLGVDPQVLRESDREKWPDLAALLGLPYAQLERVLNTKARPIQTASSTSLASAAASDSAPATAAAVARPIRWAKLREDIDEATYEKIRSLGIKGVYGNRVFRRVYPHNALAAHLVGYVNKEGTAAAGVEAYADFYLRGQDGWREGERDGARRELAQFRTREVEPTNGYNVVLSTDIIVQHLVEEELARIARELRPDKATIIVSDARTGFILGMGNYPSFDLNAYAQAPLDVQRNFAITDQIDPGSTFKIVPTAAALNEGLVRPDTRFDCSTEQIEYRGRMLRAMPDTHRHDQPLSVAEIISRSSNIGVARLGMLLGEQRLYDYARAFGFGEKSGFPFGGEISGQLNPVKQWSAIDITRIPAGYSVSATPLQVHYAMSVIASGGELLRPQIIAQVRDASGEVVYSFDRAVRRRVISSATAREMARMLQSVAAPGGTAREAAIPGYEVAGKTGTAQKLVNGRYSNRAHVGSFVGFFPASRPEVVISVIVDNARLPNGRSAYGRIVAAPSFKRIGEQLVQYLDIKPAGSVSFPSATPTPSRPLFTLQGTTP